MDLPALADVHLLLPFHQIREQVHHGDEVGQLLQDDDGPLLSAHQRPRLVRLLDAQQILILHVPLLNKLPDAPPPLVGHLVHLVEHVVDVLLLGVLQFGEDAGLVDADVLVLVVDERAQEVQQVGLVVPLYAHVVYHLRDLDRDVLHEGFVVEDVLVVVEQLGQQQDRLAVLPLPQHVQRLQVSDSNLRVVDGHLISDIGVALVGGQHALALLLNVVLDLIDHEDHFLLGLLEVPGEEGEEAVDVLEDLFGVVVEGVEGLLAESDELEQDGVEIFVLDEALMELVDPRLLAEVLENGEVVVAAEGDRQVRADFDGLAQPHQEALYLLVGVFLLRLTVKQTFLLQLVELLALVHHLLGQVLAIPVVVETQTQQQVRDVGGGVEVPL